MSVRANAKILRQIPLFADCETAHLQVLAFASERVEFDAGQDIFRAGASGSSAVLLLSGEAEIWTGKDEERSIVALAGPGALVGEFAMIAGLAYSVNATATSQVTAARIGRDTFMRVVEEFPEFGARVMGALSRKLTGSVGDFEGIRHLFESAS